MIILVDNFIPLSAKPLCMNYAFKKLFDKTFECLANPVYIHGYH